MNKTEALNLEIDYFSSGKLDKKAEKFLKKRGKKVLLILSAITLFVFNKVFFHSIFLNVLSAGIVTTKLIVDIKNDFYRSFKQESIKDIEEQPVKEENFYTDEYVYESSLQKKETEDTKKYRLALEKQQERNGSYQKNIKQEVLTKEDVMEELATDIDIYYYVYKLPPFEVKNNEWDILFDKTYNLFSKKGLEKDFYEVMTQMNRLVLAEALVEQKESIKIEDYINNLYYLKFYGIKTKESLLVQKEILEEIKTHEIIDFTKVRKKKIKDYRV